MNILFVAPGRRVSLLEKFRSEKRSEDRMILADSSTLIPTRELGDIFYHVEKWESKEFLNQIRDIVSNEKIDGIISLMDPATKIICQSELYKKLLCTTPSLNMVASDKLATSLFFQYHGLKTPNLHDYNSIKNLKVASNSELTWNKMIAKPRFGYGARDQILIRNLEELEWFQKYHRETSYIIQDFVPHIAEFTVDCFKDQYGDVIAVVPRQRLEIRSGEVQKGRTVNEAKLIDMIRHYLLPHMDFTGMICIQVLVQGNDSHKVYTFLEINDRFGGGAPLSIQAGLNAPKWIWQILRGEEIPKMESFKEITMMRADREFYIDG